MAKISKEQIKAINEIEENVFDPDFDPNAEFLALSDNASPYIFSSSSKDYFWKMFTESWGKEELEEFFEVDDLEKIKKLSPEQTLRLFYDKGQDDVYEFWGTNTLENIIKIMKEKYDEDSFDEGNYQKIMQILKGQKQEEVTDSDTNLTPGDFELMDWTWDEYFDYEYMNDDETKYAFIRFNTESFNKDVTYYYSPAKITADPFYSYPEEEDFEVNSTKHLTHSFYKSLDDYEQGKECSLEEFAAFLETSPEKINLIVKKLQEDVIDRYADDYIEAYRRGHWDDSMEIDDTDYDMGDEN